jgi:hypothetical protein
MKKIFLSFLIVFICGFLFPTQIFAAAEFQSFSASLSFNALCQPLATFSTTITPSTMTNGHAFLLSVNPLDANGQVLTSNGNATNGFTSSSQDHVVNIPLNGIVNNQTFSLSQSINVNTSYQMSLSEYAGPFQFVNSSTPMTVTPTQGPCININAQTEVPIQEAPSLDYMDIEVENPISVNSIPDLVETVLEGLIKIGIPLLVVMIVYSGWLYLLARGDPGKIKSAHDMFTYTLIGGAILLGAWALAQLIHSTLLELTVSLVQIFV